MRQNDVKSRISDYWDFCINRYLLFCYDTSNTDIKSQPISLLLKNDRLDALLSLDYRIEVKNIYYSIFLLLTVLTFYYQIHGLLSFMKMDLIL